jgi:hypothetical protein
VRVAQPGQLDLFNLKMEKKQTKGGKKNHMGIINSTERKIALNRWVEQNLMRLDVHGEGETRKKRGEMTETTRLLCSIRETRERARAPGLSPW